MIDPQADRIDPEKIRFVEINGLRTRYYEDGQGEPLVFIHGGQFGALGALDVWSLNLGPLAERFHVYGFDRPGMGYTDNPRQAVDATFAANLQHMYGFFQSLGIRGANVVGHSRSGLMAACMAIDHPELVKRLVIVDSYTLAPENPDVRCGTFYQDLLRRIPTGTPTAETVRMEFEGLSYSPKHVTSPFVARMHEIALLPKTRELKENCQALLASSWLPGVEERRFEILHQIENHGLPVPTLLIWGVNDPSAPVDRGLALYAKLCQHTPKAELHLINRSGHYPFREHPTAFLRVLQAFCQS